MSIEYTTAAKLQAEIERLRAALKEITELGDVRSDEAHTIAIRALKEK